MGFERLAVPLTVAAGAVSLLLGIEAKGSSDQATAYGDQIIDIHDARLSGEPYTGVIKTPSGDIQPPHTAGDIDSALDDLRDGEKDETFQAIATGLGSAGTFCVGAVVIVAMRLRRRPTKSP